MGFEMVNGFIDHLYTRLVITLNVAPPLITTIKKLSRHPLSLFQFTISSPAVPRQRLLTVEILQLYMLKSSLHRTKVEVALGLRFTPSQFVLAPSPLRLTIGDIFFN
jgi:hypothetical protein